MIRKKDKGERIKGELTAVELIDGEVKTFSSRGTLSRYLQRRKASLDRTGAIRQGREVIGHIITTARRVETSQSPWECSKVYSLADFPVDEDGTVLIPVHPIPISADEPQAAA